MKHPITGLIFLAASTPAFAQAFNVDVGANTTFPLPSPTLGAAAAQPGVWNNVPGTQGLTTPLVNITGASTGVTIACSPGTSVNFQFNNAGTTGDDQNLMDDASDPGAGGATWTISGLAPGNYKLYTYAWAPDSASFFSNVAVSGSSDPPQLVGGSWPGGYVQGVTHALHHVSTAGSIAMTITVATSFATLNGFQVVPVAAPPGVTFCEPGIAGVIACPCGNAPSGLGRGCDNSSLTGGAALTDVGVASLAGDTVVFTCIDEKPTATSIVLQGNVTVTGGIMFGDGVRCAGGALKRLYVKTAVAGSITAPNFGAGDPTVSSRSATLGDVIIAGTTRDYQVYYRDPQLFACLFGPPATYNISQARRILWNP